MTSYLTSTKNLEGILNAIKGARAPEKFTQSFLESLEFKSSSDRLYIPILKGLGFLDVDAKPTERYYTFLDQSQSGAVLAEGIKGAYEELFKVNINAHELAKPEVKNKLKTLTQGQLTEDAYDRILGTFVALVAQADFQAKLARSDSAETDNDQSLAATSDMGRNTRKINSGSGKWGGLHYNIQIILPSTRDPAVYDAIFRSLR